MFLEAPSSYITIYDFSLSLVCSLRTPPKFIGGQKALPGLNIQQMVGWGAGKVIGQVDHENAINIYWDKHKLD